jgi:hypothetical protein
MVDTPRTPLPADPLEWPTRPGSTPDTEFMQNPKNGLWYQVPRALTKQETLADVVSKLGLSEETLKKIARAERERIMGGFADHRIN